MYVNKVIYVIYQASGFMFCTTRDSEQSDTNKQRSIITMIINRSNTVVMERSVIKYWGGA